MIDTGALGVANVMLVAMTFTSIPAISASIRATGERSPQSARVDVAISILRGIIAVRFIMRTKLTIYLQINKAVHQHDGPLYNECDADAARAMADGARSAADVIEGESPDIVVVLGDRFEILGIAAVANVMRVPVVHISGGGGLYPENGQAPPADGTPTLWQEYPTEWPGAE